jgi:hypothetical protein
MTRSRKQGDVQRRKDICIEENIVPTNSKMTPKTRNARLKCRMSRQGKERQH